MYRVVTQLKPENFADFTAIPAIYRPGPLESGTTRQFIARKERITKGGIYTPIAQKCPRRILTVYVFIRNR